MNSAEPPLKIQLTGTSIKGNVDQQVWPGIFKGLFTMDYEGIVRG